jgi:hypothetical protein
VALRDLRESKSSAMSKAFYYLVPMLATFRADLETEGILFELRNAFCTVLQRRGVTMSTAQELMRHSDPRLTGDVYTDATALPLFDKLRKATASAPSLLASQKREKRGLNGDKPDQITLFVFASGMC